MTDDTTKKPENPMLRIKSFEEGWQVFTRAVRHMPPDVQELVPMSIWKTVFYAGGRTVMGLVHDAVISGEGAAERTVLNHLGVVEDPCKIDSDDKEQRDER